jgi:hypothetical protein
LGEAAFAAQNSTDFATGSSLSLVRRGRVYRKRMDTGPEFIGKRLVDHAMAGYPALPPECVSHNIYSEVRFSPRPVSGVAFMVMGLVEHLQAQRIEGLRQFPRNGFLQTHRSSW